MKIESCWRRQRPILTEIGAHLGWIKFGRVVVVAARVSRVTRLSWRPGQLHDFSHKHRRPVRLTHTSPLTPPDRSRLSLAHLFNEITRPRCLGRSSLRRHRLMALLCIGLKNVPVLSGYFATKPY